MVNYDLPNVPEDYVHRIGRTGRAGASGEAISLVCVDEHGFLRDIERLIKREIPADVVPGFAPDPNAKAEPILQRQPRGGGGQGHSGKGRSSLAHGQGRGGSVQAQGTGCQARTRPGLPAGRSAAGHDAPIRAKR